MTSAIMQLVGMQRRVCNVLILKGIILKESKYVKRAFLREVCGFAKGLCAAQHFKREFKEEVQHYHLFKLALTAILAYLK